MKSVFEDSSVLPICTYILNTLVKALNLMVQHIWMNYLMFVLTPLQPVSRKLKCYVFQKVFMLADKLADAINMVCRLMIIELVLGVAL